MLTVESNSTMSERRLMQFPSCDQRQQGPSSSSAPKAKAQTDGKIHSKSSGSRGESPSGEERFRAEISFGESVRIRHVIFGTLPCLNFQSESGCKYGDNCRFRHVEANGQPIKKSKKSGVKGSVALLKESIQLGCVSQDSHPKTCSM